MVADEDLSADERATVELAKRLMATGNLNPLIRRLRNGESGPEGARDALHILAEFDPELLVQIALDTLIGQYVEDPGLAHQTRRELRGDGDGDGDGHGDVPSG